MGKAIFVLGRIYDRLITSLANVSGAIYVFLAVAITCHIVGRRFFAFPIPGLVEVSEYLLSISIFLAAAWILKEDGHIKIDIVLRRLKPRSRALTNVITSSILALAFLIFTGFGASVTWDAFITGYFFLQQYKTPVWILMIFVPLACFLLAIGFARNAYRNLQLMKRS